MSEQESQSFIEKPTQEEVDALVARFRANGIGVITDDRDHSSSFGLRGPQDISTIYGSAYPRDNLSMMDRIFLPKIARDYLHGQVTKQPVPLVLHFPFNIGRFEKAIH